MSLNKRSYKKELLDAKDIPFADIQRNMQELDFINTYLGGHQITLTGIKDLIPEEGVIHIVEVGCGGGDNLRAIKNWFSKKKFIVELTGIDINRQCIAFANSRRDNAGIKFICSDYKEAQFENIPHIIFSSLFCHHFTDEELVFMMRWMNTNCRQGFFINDLHRHPFAYHSIKWLTKVFSKSYMVKNDAPLSVARGFKKTELENYLSEAGIKHYKVIWKWAFRWMIIAKKTSELK